jgi:hypothetical protein
MSLLAGIPAAATAALCTVHHFSGQCQYINPLVPEFSFKF